MSAGTGQSGVGGLVEDARLNALLAWALVGFVLVVVVGNALGGSLIWAGFAGAVLVLALAVPVGFRTPMAMLPWEVLGLAILPLIGRTFATVPVTSKLATYLSVAAVALIVAVELQVFTSVEMSPRFAVGFVVIATMAAAGAWAVARFALDLGFGTGLLFDPSFTEEQLEAVERDLMFEFVYSTVAGLLAGVIFEGYFRRRRRRESVLPPEVEV